jgi:hypothetical protein
VADLLPVGLKILSTKTLVSPKGLRSESDTEGGICIGVIQPVSASQSEGAVSFMIVSIPVA